MRAARLTRQADLIASGQSSKREACHVSQRRDRTPAQPRDRAEVAVPGHRDQKDVSVLGDLGRRRARRDQAADGHGARRAVSVELQGRHRADPPSRRRAGHHGRLGAPFADPDQSRARAETRDRLDHVHRLSAERPARGDAAAQAFAERDPLRVDRQGKFHRGRRRKHHLRPRRHGADAERHLAQSRQCRERARDQPLGARPAAGRDPERDPFRPRLHRVGRRQAGEAEGADRQRADRLFGAHLRPWRAEAALRPSTTAARRPPRRCMSIAGR